MRTSFSIPTAAELREELEDHEVGNTFRTAEPELHPILEKIAENPWQL